MFLESSIWRHQDLEKLGDFSSWNMRTSFLKLINYSCSSYPTRAFYSGQVNEFRNPRKNELKTWSWRKPVFETISNTDAIFFNLHIDKATKTRGDKQLYLISHFAKQTLNLNYLLLTLNVTEQSYRTQNRKGHLFSKFKFSLNSGDLVFWFTFNLAVHLRPKMALALEILSD